MLYPSLGVAFKVVIGVWISCSVPACLWVVAFISISSKCMPTCAEANVVDGQADVGVICQSLTL